ncbi:hypothetical protein [Pantoea ananatis]|uniref:hypothetical protein n=1 Tax=Pantoea ananas TaxID=553 RepID=UPI001B30F5AF|nr:hypothetical protein [Pantoea ananatis]
MSQFSKEPEFDEAFYKKAVNRFNELHSSIFGSISSMLSQAKIQPMGTLRGKNPSFTALVDELELYRTIAGKLGTLLGGSNANLAMIDEYLELARSMADAIDGENHDGLCAAIAALDEKPYI